MDAAPTGPYDAEPSAQAPQLGWMTRRGWHRYLRCEEEAVSARYARCPRGHWVLFCDAGDYGHFVRFVRGRPMPERIHAASEDWLTWWRTRRV
jgi:hypothetical protein